MIYIAIILTLTVGLFLVRHHEVILRRTVARHDGRARQASHVGEPLRYGGVAVFVGILFSSLTLGNGTDDPFFMTLLISAAPVTLVGLAEDMGYAMSPRRRLIAAMVSAAVAIALLDAFVPRANLPGFDWMMSSYTVALALTILFSAGFCHAMNLIDGMNGLATTYAIFAALGLSFIASAAGQIEIMVFALILAACLGAFLTLNWPSARMFLGDAGAYGIGHLLAWIAIMLVARVDEVSVSALLLVLFWPLADVFHTIYRRVADRKHAFEPDRMHLHHKVRRTLDLVFFGYNAKAVSNPLTTLVLAPFMALPIAMGMLFWNQAAAGWVALAFYMAAFATAHKLTTHFALRYRKPTR